MSEMNSSAIIAEAMPVVDALAIISVWAMHFFRALSQVVCRFFVQNGQTPHSHTDLHHNWMEPHSSALCRLQKQFPVSSPCCCSAALLACVACDVRHMRQPAEAAHKCAGEGLQNPCGAGDRRCGRLCCHSF